MSELFLSWTVRIKKQTGIPIENITVKLPGINIRKTIQRSIGLKINPETSLSVRLHHEKITQQHGSQLTTMDKS